MKYTQRVSFFREFVIEAPNAEKANEILQDGISTSEFQGDVQCDSFEDFEDEPIDCPKCEGNGEINGKECDLCQGTSSVPFGTVYTK